MRKIAGKLVCTKRAAPARSKIHGWGMFATEDIEVGETIDESPLELISTTEHVAPFASWLYAVEVDGVEWYGLVKGDGALFNSSDEPNATFDFAPKGAAVRVEATLPIRAGEEIFLAYYAE